MNDYAYLPRHDEDGQAVDEKIPEAIGHDLAPVIPVAAVEPCVPTDTADLHVAVTTPRRSVIVTMSTDNTASQSSHLIVCDASVRNPTGRVMATLGIVVFDPQGENIYSEARTSPSGSPKSEKQELEAIFAALSVVTKIGLRNIVLANDNVSAVGKFTAMLFAHEVNMAHTLRTFLNCFDYLAIRLATKKEAKSAHRVAARWANSLIQGLSVGEITERIDQEDVTGQTI